MRTFSILPSLEEFSASQTASGLGLANTPDAAELPNWRRLAAVHENVRTLPGCKPILISSTFRSAAVNKAAGGVANGAHARGLAADFISPASGTPLQICNVISCAASIPFDQLIFEGTRVHYAIPAKSNDAGQREVLTAHFTNGPTMYTRSLTRSDSISTCWHLASGIANLNFEQSAETSPVQIASFNHAFHLQVGAHI
ncbi:D-Ala-D-Ala carboxypeptidase family metallohydrolase [Paraburkholderia tropica]|uniref:D-Ala-D-Ala carboxypeptidase family metallohydrolase n=1 Tax=Paraburkholderia tropica TaxID=92647 RepID=UPI002AB64C1C|nr:D-Ala-D-Ala carboxypeptidase family metallohydrolase [Paraburkholderia tropica]